jgi:uncharacterized protein YukE
MQDLAQERKAIQDMWDKPNFDPYDAIQELTEMNVQHQQNILELSKAINSQANQIATIIKAMKDHREHIGNLIVMIEHKQDK